MKIRGYGADATLKACREVSYGVAPLSGYPDSRPVVPGRYVDHRHVLAYLTTQTMLPRGIRNNNPLNIRLSPDNRWQGRVPPKHNSDGAFEQFQEPVTGLRAAAVLLIAHYDRRHLDTIRKLVWAPPNENDTEAYARCVAKASGFGIDEPLDLHDYACLRPILVAMIRIENGPQPYAEAQIDAALTRAGVVPPERSLQETRTSKAGR